MDRAELGLGESLRPPALPPTMRARSGGVGRLVRRSPVVAIGAVLIVVVVLLALAAQFIAPYSPVAQIAQPLLRPGPGFLAGTDELGRDELSRLIFGAQVSLYVGILAVSIALAGGATSGILAGFYGGWVDNALMRVMDVLFSLPAIVLAIAITSILRPSLTNAMIAIGIVYAPTFARIARGPTLAVVNLAYMEAALSFLGLGTQPPTASWGLMLSAARQYMLIDPWIAIFPGVAIALTVLGFNLLGDGLRDLLDPRIRTV